eukprot:CAMPEP_0115616550 /NCGR_PEP_ID=MMETSP0272-20121206/23194_1 /TAXON_ID=71861 /ORGANISM="Scrippsiella trochoidea, Strain CCMP3099" /LENGTH=307 /DNA_ID=CAMNT_0003052493 /DNA_START=82 /DNA_END=1005 /DNA_ORIENTATION=+
MGRLCHGVMLALTWRTCISIALQSIQLLQELIPSGLRLLVTFVDIFAALTGVVLALRRASRLQEPALAFAVCVANSLLWVALASAITVGAHHIYSGDALFIAARDACSTSLAFLCFLPGLAWMMMLVKLLSSELQQVVRWCRTRGPCAPRPTTRVCADFGIAAAGECAICFERLTDLPDLEIDRGYRVGCCQCFGEEVGPLRLPCEHTFHEACARRWMAQENSCPLCRQAILDVSQCTRLRPGRSRGIHQDQDQDVDLERGQVGDCGPASAPEVGEDHAQKNSSMRANGTDATVGASSDKTASQMDV